MNILLVEDNPADVRLTQEALHEIRVGHSLRSLRNGLEAIEYFGSGHAEDDEINLVLLDLNLPGKNGREVLEVMNQHPFFRLVPVVILSGSTEAAAGCGDLVRSRVRHREKPHLFEQVVAMFSEIHAFWKEVWATNDGQIQSAV
jgi:CheY-like chemotaxis protein